MGLYYDNEACVDKGNCKKPWAWLKNNTGTAIMDNDLINNLVCFIDEAPFSLNCASGICLDGTVQNVLKTHILQIQI